MKKKIPKGPVPLQSFEAAIHDGIRAAHVDYPKLSGLCVSQAPEYYLTTKIAGEMQKLNLYIDLERSVNKTLKDAKATSPGRLSAAIRGNGRFDFVAHYNHDTPRFIGEVKHSVVSHGRITADIQRISAVLNRGKHNTLQNGVIALYAHNATIGKAVQKLEKFLCKLQHDCLTLMGPKRGQVKVNYKPLDQNPDYASASVCILIKKPSTSQVANSATRPKI